MTQNLAVTQYTAKDEVYLIDDVKPTDKLLWVSDDNIVVKRSDALGGINEITIVEDTSATVHFSGDDTGLLSSLGSNLKLLRIGAHVADDDLFDGTITVTAAAKPTEEAVDPVEQIINDPTQQTFYSTDIELGGKHNTVIGNPPSVLEQDVTLPSSRTLKGKLYWIFNEGPGVMNIKTKGGATFIVLDPDEKTFPYALGRNDSENSWLDFAN